MTVITNINLQTEIRGHDNCCHVEKKIITILMELLDVSFVKNWSSTSHFV